MASPRPQVLSRAISSKPAFAVTSGGLQLRVARRPGMVAADTDMETLEIGPALAGDDA
jgi:hypothetical protein